MTAPDPACPFAGRHLSCEGCYLVPAVGDRPDDDRPRGPAMSRAGAKLQRDARRQDSQAQAREDARRRRRAERGPRGERPATMLGLMDAADRERMLESVDRMMGATLGMERRRTPIFAPSILEPHAVAMAYAKMADRLLGDSAAGPDCPESPVLCIPPAGTNGDFFALARQVAQRLDRPVLMVGPGPRDHAPVEMPRQRVTLAWVGTDDEDTFAIWGVEPLALTFWARRSALGGFRGSASTLGCTFWWQGKVGSGQPPSVPTLAEAQAACEAWLEDWLRRSCAGEEVPDAR